MILFLLDVCSIYIIWFGEFLCFANWNFVLYDWADVYCSCNVEVYVFSILDIVVIYLDWIAVWERNIGVLNFQASTWGNITDLLSYNVFSVRIVMVF
jgi:hypothetical protein